MPSQQGSYARVHTGFCDDFHTEIAVKVIALQGCPGSNRRRNSQLEALQEARLLQSLQSHKNIIQFIGTEARGDEFFILQEKVSSSMRDLLGTGRPFSKSTAQHYAHQVLEALEFLHSKCIAHRDVKPANVLVEQSSGIIKLIDFGACLELEGHNTLAVSMAGTPRYCAPEVLQNEAHGVAVDIWSFGCTFLQMVSCVVPWSGYKCTTLVALLHIVQQFRAPQLPPHLTQEMRCLLTSCLAWSPEGRPTAQELLLLYDSCSAVACPVCTHSCPQAQLTHTGGRVSSAYTDVA
eukprot:1410-Heterococcus_DN1.PRE.10